MPLPADLSALSMLRFIFCVLPAFGWAADLTLLVQDGTTVSGQPTLSGTNLTLGSSTVPLAKVVGISGAAATPSWIDQGLVLANGDHLRGTILGLQKGTFSCVSDLLGAIDIPVGDLSTVILVPRRAGEALPPGFTGALFVNGDRLPGKLAYIDERNIGIDNGRKVLAIPRERVGMVVLRPIAISTTANQVLRLANGDRVSGQLKAWGPTGLDVTTARGVVHCATGELSSLWNEGASFVPFTANGMSGLMPGVAVDALPNGMPLVAGSRRYGHGLGIRGAASLSVTSDGTINALIGEVAVLEGRAKVQVQADEKIVWESGTLAAGEVAKPFTAVVTGAKQIQILTVVVDESLPLTVVGWPTLVK